MRWLVLVGLALSLTLTACGGDNDKATATTTATTAAGGVTPSAATATSGGGSGASGTATATGGQPSGGGVLPRGVIALSGAVSRQLTATAACSDGVLHEDLQAIITQTDGGMLWMAQVYVNQFKTKGAGDYDTGPVGSSSDASVTLNDGAGHTWSTTDAGQGRVTVNDDGQSGALDVTLTSDDGGQPVTAAGSFVCAAE